MIFSKFLQSDKLGALVEDDQKSKMVTTSCQTEPDENEKVKWRKKGGFNRKGTAGFFKAYFAGHE